MSHISDGWNLRAVTMVTSGASYSVNDFDAVVVINKGTGSATGISLPNVTSSLQYGRVIWIKDGKGDAATNRITITDPASNTIDGQSALVISTNYGKAALMWNGRQWNQLV